MKIEAIRWKGDLIARWAGVVAEARDTITEVRAATSEVVLCAEKAGVSAAATCARRYWCSWRSSRATVTNSSRS
jgi:hypothetical protein